jgi:hypothetical protein
MERGNEAETELARVAVKPTVEAAQHNSGGSGGGAWLEATTAAERGGARGGGVPEAERGNGVEAGLQHGAAKPTVVADWRGGGWSSGGGRPEFAGVWRRAGAAWGERGRECRARETRGNGRGEHGDALYGLGREKLWPDVADLRRQRLANIIIDNI